MGTLAALSFIVGILSILTVFYVYTSIKITQQYKYMTTTYDALINEHKRHLEVIQHEKQTTDATLRDILEKMEVDSYESISKVNSELIELRKKYESGEAQNAMIMKGVETEFTKVYNDLQTLQQRIRNIVDNPNLQSRY